MNHAVEETLAGVRRNPHDKPIGQHSGATRHAAPVPAAFANERGAFTRDRTFIDRCHTGDHLAIARYLVARLSKHQISLMKIGCGQESRLAYFDEMGEVE